MAMLYDDEFSIIAKIGVFGTICSSILWTFIAIALVVLCAWVYGDAVVNADRERYTKAVAQRLGVHAAEIVAQAVMVHDAVEYAVSRKLFFEPSDYASARRALEGAFAATDALRAVEMVFTNRTTSISLRRVIKRFGVDPGPLQGPPPVTVLAQSDGADCLDTLGPLGCSAPGTWQSAWVEAASKLSNGVESIDDPEAPQEGISYRWLDEPFFVPRDNEQVFEIPGSVATTTKKPAIQYNRWKAGKEDHSGYTPDNAKVAWETACALIFRTPFPGTQGLVSLLGRITLDFGAMRAAGNLVDLKGLGKGGAVFICSRSGVLVASTNPGLQALLQPNSGPTRQRFAWELSYPWASSLSASDFALSSTSTRLLPYTPSSAGYQVVIEPLVGRGVDHFVILVAGEKDPFYDDYLLWLGGLAYALSSVPLGGLLLLFVFRRLLKEYRRRRALRRVHDEEAAKRKKKPRRRLPRVNSTVSEASSNFTRTTSNASSRSTTPSRR